MQHDIPFDIDRHAVRRYKAREGRGLVLVLGLVVAHMAGILRCIDAWKQAGAEAVWHELLLTSVAYASGACIVVVSVVWTLAWLCGWRHAERYADNLRVAIEGPFLHVVEYGRQLIDRKIHFNQLMDYSVVQDPAMRAAGLYGIRIGANQVMVGSQAARSSILLLGIVDAYAARDLLARIDSEREGQTG